MTEATLKRSGMLTAASADRFHLERARRMAHKLGSEMGLVSIDDVRSALPDLPASNFLGSVFKDKCWVFHAYKRAEHEGSHARVISVWRYIPGIPVKSPVLNPASLPHQQQSGSPSQATQGLFKGEQLEMFEGVNKGIYLKEITYE